MSSRENAILAPVLRRVTRRRVSYLTELFADFGFSPRDALRRAQVAYGSYIGLFVMRHTNGAVVPSLNGSTDAFIADLVELLTRA